MNERIQKLAEQAEEDTRIKHVNAYWRMQDELAEDATWREKFAELIVRECAKQCTTDGPFGAEVVWGKQFHKKILDHFGVE